MNANGNAPSADTLEVALLTVCADRQTVEQVEHVGEQTGWALCRADFDSYPSPAARPQFSPQITAAHACVAVVDLDANPEQALETANFLDRYFYGRIAIVALSSATAPDLLLRAMRAGCNEFLGKPLVADQLFATLKRLDARWTAAASRVRRSGNVLSFFGAKGGVGTTILAVHLGMFLLQCHKKKTLLIDNHRELGHVCLYLGLDDNHYHFKELVRNVDRLDSDLLQGFIAHHPSGLEVLASPNHLEASEDTDPDAIARTLDFLRGEYDYVLLDGDANLQSASLAAIGRSDHVYMIATPEIGSIRDLSRYVDRLMDLDPTPDKLHVIINRFSSRDAISSEQIEKAIRLPISIKIPNSYNELVHSINVGAPVSREKKSDFSLHMQKWADAIVGSSAAAVSAPVKKRFALWL